MVQKTHDGGHKVYPSSELIGMNRILCDRFHVIQYPCFSKNLGHLHPAIRTDKTFAGGQIFRPTTVFYKTIRELGVGEFRPPYSPGKPMGVSC